MPGDWEGGWRNGHLCWCSAQRSSFCTARLRRGATDMLSMPVTPDMVAHGTLLCSSLATRRFFLSGSSPSISAISAISSLASAPSILQSLRPRESRCVGSSSGRSHKDCYQNSSQDCYQNVARSDWAYQSNRCSPLVSSSLTLSGSQKFLENLLLQAIFWAKYCQVHLSKQISYKKFQKN